MIDLEYLSRLISLLKKEKVTHFKKDDLLLTFGEPGESPEALISTLKKQEESLPPDLRADDLMNFDKVLNWSGSPDSSELEMPLTGDLPL